MSAPTNVPQKITIEMIYSDIAFLSDTLQRRMKKVSDMMTEMNNSVTIANTGYDPHRRIQKERRRAQTRRRSGPMKALLRRHMIFNHDITVFLKRYTDLFIKTKRMIEYLTSGLVPTPLPPYVFDDRNDLDAMFRRYEPLYQKIHVEYQELKEALASIQTRPHDNHNDNNSNSNSNHNAERVPTVRFGPDIVHEIPTKKMASDIYLLPDPVEPASPSAPSAPAASNASNASSGGKRRLRRTRKHRA